MTKPIKRVERKVWVVHNKFFGRIGENAEIPQMEVFAEKYFAEELVRTSRWFVPEARWKEQRKSLLVIPAKLTYSLPTRGVKRKKMK